MSSPYPRGEIEKRLSSLAQNPFVFLETASPDKENKNSFLFTDSVDALIFYAGGDIRSFFKAIEDYLSRGFWLSGYFSYEFGYFLEPALKPFRKTFDFPLAWLGVFRKPQILPLQNHLSSEKGGEGFPYQIKNVHPAIGKKEYYRALGEIKQYLECGYTYQVNYTFKLKFDCAGSFLDGYFSLRNAQPTAYMACINTGEEAFLSFSPELFFRREGAWIMSRPMKGTINRGRFLTEDNKHKQWLRRNKKIRAENLMIVDLLRNDMGRISEKVVVPNLFRIEQYPTLYQMTSTIKAKLKRGMTTKDIFSALFPCGSVTGAPKIKTMEIIAHLEKEPRGVYTGSIGYLAPHKKACFNVAIRTITIKGSQAEMGVGGGIIYDSIQEKEFEEALLKGKFIREKFPPFFLIETLLWEREKGYFLWPLHYKRLKHSCRYFSIPLDKTTITQTMAAVEKRLKRKCAVHPGQKYKVRIRVHRGGEVNVTCEVLEEVPVPVKIKVSDQRIDPKDVFFYHKTSHRPLYEEERKKAAEEGFFDTIFFNIRGELTEGALTNLFISKAGRIYTPPLESGLLPGTLREHLLKKGKVQEQIMYGENLLGADTVYVGNSVRGLLRAKVYLAHTVKKSKIKLCAA